MKPTYRLSPAMINALRFTRDDDLMAPGPTRAALMRRGLVFSRSAPGRFGFLTEAGKAEAARLRELAARGDTP